MNNKISIKNLNFKYKNDSELVLKNININIEKNKIFGLLGPSGAGKTTLMKLITGQLCDKKGCVFIDGKKVTEYKNDLYQKFGIVMDSLGLYDRLTCYENVMLFAKIHNVADFEVKEVLELVGLKESMNKKVLHISTGMKQRVMIARAIIHSPEILLLDEPTRGLDPTTANEIHNLIMDIKNNGTTVLLTTHNMEETEKLCDNIALINNGYIIENDTPENIKRKYFKDGLVKVYTKDSKEEKVDFLEKPNELIDMIKRKKIVTIHSQEPSLEEIFINLTGEQLNDK